MLPTMFGCAQQGSGSPLAVSITTPDTVLIAVEVGQSGGQSGAGDITSTATASGGDGSYSYAWSLTEVEDFDGAFAIVTQGTTNAATYDTAEVSTNYHNQEPLPPPNPPPPPPPNPAVYRVSCTVTDGTGATATANALFDVEAVG